MRNRRSTGNRTDHGRDGAARWLGLPAAFLARIGWGARDAFALMVGAGGAVAVLVNALFLQNGPHPAPLFKTSLLSIAPADATSSVPVAVPRARPAEAAPAKVEAPTLPRTQAEIMSDIQRELARRGFYDGAINGVHGPKTDGAIRDFEQAAGLRPSLQANEVLLQAIVKSNMGAAKMAAAPAGAAAHGDAIADLLSARRVMALQRALAQYGYGQLKPTGVTDAETRAAIEKFERERKMPITGQPSERVARELAALTGRPID